MLKHYKVKASVTANVEITILAASEKVARAMFDERIIMTASLVDTIPYCFEVSEGSISSIDRVAVEKE